MVHNRFSFMALAGLVLLLGYLNYLVLKPFLTPIIWAIVLSILFYPAYILVLRYIRYRSIASVVTLIAILVIIIGPFSYLSFLLANELTALQRYAEGGKVDVIRSLLQHPVVRSTGEAVISVAGMTAEDLDRIIADNIAQFGKEVVGKITRGVREVLSGLLGVILGPLILAVFVSVMNIFVRVDEKGQTA